MIELGKRYKDTVTGFEGVATARYEYLNGCVRYQLEAPKQDSGGILELIFDEQRLELVKEEQERGIRRRRTGGSMPAPPRVGAGG